MIDSMLHYPDYHIHVKHVIIAINIKSNRTTNTTLLIVYNKINTESNILRSSKYFS